MKRAACLALVAVLAASSAAAPADAFLMELLAAKFGGKAPAASAKPVGAASAVVAEPVVAAEPAAAPLAAAPRPMMMMAKPAAMAKPAVAAMAKPAAVAATAKPAAAAMAAAAPAACPPEGFDSAANFDLARYVDGRWYTFAQRPVSYQPPDSLFCVTALYTPIEGGAPAGKGGVDVRNYSNRGGVNGGALGTSGAGGPDAPSRPGGPPAGKEPFAMIALPHPVGGPNSTDPATAASKLIVGPKQFLSAAPAPVLARLLGPNYQIAAFDEAGYQWAVVVSGKPDVPGKGGLCKFGGDSGFWLFSREPVVSAATRAAVEAAAEAKGLDTSDLVAVGQAGCKYEGAR